MELWWNSKMECVYWAMPILCIPGMAACLSSEYSVTSNQCKKGTNPKTTSSDLNAHTASASLSVL